MQTSVLKNVRGRHRRHRRDQTRVPMACRAIVTDEQRQRALAFARAKARAGRLSTCSKKRVCIVCHDVRRSSELPARESRACLGLVRARARRERRGCRRHASITAKHRTTRSARTATTSSARSRSSDIAIAGHRDPAASATAAATPTPGKVVSTCISCHGYHLAEASRGAVATAPRTRRDEAMTFAAHRAHSSCRWRPRCLRRRRRRRWRRGTPPPGPEPPDGRRRGEGDRAGGRRGAGAEREGDDRRRRPRRQRARRVQDERRAADVHDHLGHAAPGRSRRRQRPAAASSRRSRWRSPARTCRPTGNAFSTRTASQIVQELQPAAKATSPAGRCSACSSASSSCSDVDAARRRDGTIGPKRAPLGLAAEPGGLPLYKNGVVVGGIGVMADGRLLARPRHPRQRHERRRTDRGRRHAAASRRRPTAAPIASPSTAARCATRQRGAREQSRERAAVRVDQRRRGQSRHVARLWRQPDRRRRRVRHARVGISAPDANPAFAGHRRVRAGRRGERQPLSAAARAPTACSRVAEVTQILQERDRGREPRARADPPARSGRPRR